ncbi:MAG: hypothetical protein EZS28_033607, partial [Streblomastix strix]
GFGLSRKLQQGKDYLPFIGGTLLYLPPEFLQVKSGQSGEQQLSISQIKAADIWALGITLFEILAQYHPFVGSDIGIPLNELIRRVTEDNPPELPLHYPENMRNLIKAMLDKNPDQRITAKQIIYIYFSPYIKGRARFADVEYETHQEAESFVKSTPQQRIYGGVILQVRWDIGQQTIKQKKIDERMKMKKENKQDEIEDDDRSENNAVNFQGIRSTMKNNEMLKIVSRFGLVKKFLKLIPTQQEEVKEEQDNQSLIVEYINKEGMNEALKADGQEIEGCKLKIDQYKSDIISHVLDENLQDPNIVVDEIQDEIDKNRKQYDQNKKEKSEKEQNDEEQEKLNEKQSEKEKDKQDEQENQKEKIQQLKADYNFLIENIEQVKDQLERRIHPTDKNRIIGVELLKLKRGVDEQQIRSIFADYQPNNIIIDVDQRDPRYNSASIHFDDPNISIRAAQEKVNIQIDEQIVKIKLKYQPMPLEEFRRWKKMKQNKQLYAILITGFPKELTLNEFFDF